MRTVTDHEVELKNQLAELKSQGADLDTILAKTEEIAAYIIESAEAEAALKFTGHKWTEEQRKNLSDKLKGRPGKPWTDEQRAKFSASMTPEKRQALSDKLKGRKMTDEQKAKMSATMQANAAKKAEAQAALEQRVKELEAQLAGQTVEEEPQGRRGRR
jgi:hypothetical protein